MSTPSRFTRIKITTGYLLLLSVIIFSLLFIHKEIQNLSVLDTEQLLKTDSLLILLREKDENTIRMLQTLNEANENLLSIDELEQIIARQDTIIIQQRVQHRMVTTRDSVIAAVPKKGFFKRVAEVFVPSKDTTVLLNTTLELTTDTLLHEYNPVDSLQQRIKEITEQRRETHRSIVQRNNARLRRMNNILTAQVDSLIKQYQQEIIMQATREAENQQAIRKRSTLTIGGVAIGAILLSAVFLIIIWRDITRSNRYRKELEVANRRAEELLKARENLMLTITHDFKAPLSSIIGYIDLLAGETDDEEKRKLYLANMKSSSGHLLKLVSDLLDFHRLDLNKAEVNRTRFNPTQLFNEIRISFEPLTVAKGLTFHFEISPGLNAWFIGDPLRIRQVVNNLMSNAIKFTSHGSVSLLVHYTASRLTITVADTGKGMSAEDKERIFQEFTRLPGAQGEEGFGLGLSIVKKLVELLEGTVQVNSQEGKGSRFTVILPLYPVGSTALPLTPSRGGDDAGGYPPIKREYDAAGYPPLEGARGRAIPLHILLIDDDQIQLNLTSAMLTQAGITAVCSQQPNELIEHLRNETFDVLLTDVQMPAMDGFSLLTLLRSSNLPQARTIPVIAVTARSEMEEGEFERHGFAGYLNKPFTVNDLRKILQPNLTALTAFSAGDEEASRQIIQSFIVETGKDLGAMQQALANSNVDGIAAVAHKLIPLFTLINAKLVVPLLIRLDNKSNANFTAEIKEETERVIDLINRILTDTSGSYPSL